MQACAHACSTGCNPPAPYIRVRENECPSCGLGSVKMLEITTMDKQKNPKVLHDLETEAIEMGTCAMSQVAGGTSTTVITIHSVYEMEYPKDKDGNPDFGKKPVPMDVFL